MNLKQRNRVTRAINKYVRAMIADSWKGGGDPDDVPLIERRLLRARRALKRVLDESTQAPPSLEQHHGN